MKTLEVADYNSGNVLDRVTLSPDGKISYETGRARALFENLVARGATESEAFEMRTGWSNGYVVSNLA